MYEVVSSNGCITQSFLTLELTGYCEEVNPPNPNILPLPDAGNDTSVAINQSSGAIDLFNYLGGNPDANGGWTDSTRQHF